MKDFNYEELRNIQRGLVKKINLKKVNFKRIKYIGAVDVSYKKRFAKGAIVIYDNHKEEIIYEFTIEKEIKFPYVPTFLSFREIPVIEELYECSKIKPQILFLDGQGILHPLGIGLASHFGVIKNLITIGVAKKRLVGDIKKLPEREMEYAPVYYEGVLKGYCLKIGKGKRFLWISPGNLITPEEALKITLKFIKNGRHILLHRADRLSKK